MGYGQYIHAVRLKLDGLTGAQTIGSFSLKLVLRITGIPAPTLERTDEIVVEWIFLAAHV